MGRSFVVGRRELLAVAFSVVLGACGGGGSSSPSAPATQPPDTGAAPAGGAGPGSTTGPSGTTGPDATPTATPNPTPTPTPNPNPNPNPTPTPTPTPPAACAGLLPDAPGPGVALRQANSTGGGFAFCNDPLTDGHGDWIAVGNGYKYFNYRSVSAADPSQVGQSFQVPKEIGFDAFPIAPQPDGYHAIRTGDFPGHLQRFDAKGALLGEDRSIAAWVIQGVPGGGSVVSHEAGFPGPTIVNHVVWFGAAGDRRADVVVPGEAWIVVSSAGNVLAFAAGQARWYDRNGAALTDGFPYGFDAQRTWSPGAVLRGVALADGSVVVGLGTDRPLRFEPGSTAAAPPPDWVTSRAGATIAAVRGNRANAFATVKSAATAACEVQLELLTPDGQSCGTTTLTAPDPCEHVSFGADRTVFTMAQQPASDSVWHWWTGLLR
jgi:hypothetical protein